MKAGDFSSDMMPKDKNQTTERENRQEEAQDLVTTLVTCQT